MSFIWMLMKKKPNYINPNCTMYQGFKYFFLSLWFLEDRASSERTYLDQVLLVWNIFRIYDKYKKESYQGY